MYMLFARAFLSGPSLETEVGDHFGTPNRFQICWGLKGMCGLSKSGFENRYCSVGLLPGALQQFR